MPITNTSQAYGSVAKFFHWLIFILISFMLLLGFFMDDFSQSLKPTVYTLHKLTGLTILVLVILRILWTLVNKKPELPIGTYRLTKIIEHAVHGLLYLLLIFMPLSGWVMSCAAGYPPKLFNWTIGLPIKPNKELAHFAKDLHELFAWSLIILVSLHILAALKHHFINRDNILKRMF